MPLVSVSHVSPSVEERLQDGGVSACGLGCLVLAGFGVFVPFSTICLFFPSFNDDLGTMPTRRPYSWLLAICYDQPLWLKRSISCISIDEVMQDRTTWQVGPFYEASNFRLGQMRKGG